MNEQSGSPKQPDDVLRVSEAKFRDLVENVPVGIFVAGEDGNVTERNRHLVKMFGYDSVADMETAPRSAHYFNPVDSDRLLGLAKMGLAKNVELKLRRKNGAIFFGSFTAIPQVTPFGKLQFFVIVEDITERKESEERRREAEIRYRTLFEQSPDGVMLIDPESASPVEFNGRAHEQLGYTREEFGRVRLYEIEALKHAEMIRKHIDVILQQGEDDFVTQHRTKQGELRDVMVSVKVVELSGKRLLLTLTRDITESRKAQRQLEDLYRSERQVREQLENEIKKRAEFTRVLVHELKTPLTPVLASSEVLAAKLEQEPWLSLAKNIHRCASNLNTRIDELLDIAKGELGVLDVNTKPTDILAVLKDIAGQAGSLAASREQALVLDLPSALPLVQADESRLHQILLNLINNASKFSPQKGRITMCARESTGMVVVDVRDNGYGIREEDQKRLFELYHRVETDRQRLPGLGIGLALCKHLVELQGGRIWVESKEGNGSTFSFTLPLHIAKLSGETAYLNPA